MQKSHFIYIIILSTGGFICSGCLQDNNALYRQFSDEDPSVRKQAIVTAEELRDDKALAHIVDLLSDNDPVVRFTAILALEKWTGQTMGYLHYKPTSQRIEAIKKWRKWLADRASTTDRSKAKG